MSVRELRIHGVGGSPGEALLGLTNPDDAVVVGEGIGTVFLARRDDRKLEGYDWGHLTSGSALQPLWVLLLPFSLVNVAGWAHPSFPSVARWRLGLIRGLVHVAAALLTASWVLWIGIIAVDYLGYQWLGGYGAWPSWLDALPPRVVGVGVGFGVTAFAVWLLWFISASSRTNFEGVRAHSGLLAVEDRPDRWESNEDLASAGFFSHESSMSKRLGWHRLVIVATIAFLVLKTVVSWGEERLLLGEVFVVLGGVQVGVIILLALFCWRSGGQYNGKSSARAMPAAAVALAVALTNGVFAGIALLASRLLPEDVQPWGPELALIDGFLVTVVAWLALAVAWIVTFRQRGDADGVPPRSEQSFTACELDGADQRWRQHIATIRGVAQAAHAAPRLLAWFAAVFVLTGGVMTALRLDLSGPPWQWLDEPEPNVLLSAASWLLPALVVAVIGLVWRAATRPKLRRGIGIIWDVLTFWPRRYHPLAVRPYTERAVPEFQARNADLVDHHGGLLISAHSQGSVIAFAALASLSDAQVGRTALLTYGCPVTTLYGQVFPAYFGQQAVDDLNERLVVGAGCWLNLWRQTDPIGGPVIGNGASGDVDREVDDPATAPLSDAIPEEPVTSEALRRAWVELYGHSYYYREQLYKDAVGQLRAALEIP